VTAIFRAKMGWFGKRKPAQELGQADQGSYAGKKEGGVDQDADGTVGAAHGSAPENEPAVADPVAELEREVRVLMGEVDEPAPKEDVVETAHASVDTMGGLQMSSEEYEPRSFEMGEGWEATPGQGNQEVSDLQKVGLPMSGSPEELAVKALFHRLDSDSNDELSREEFKSMPGLEGLPQEQMDAFFDSFDVDHNGSISEEEFRAYKWLHKQVNLREAKTNGLYVPNFTPVKVFGVQFYYEGNVDGKRKPIGPVTYPKLKELVDKSVIHLHTRVCRKPPGGEVRATLAIA
jgi:hypothetical protein